MRFSAFTRARAKSFFTSRRSRREGDSRGTRRTESGTHVSRLSSLDVQPGLALRPPRRRGAALSLSYSLTQAHDGTPPSMRLRTRSMRVHHTAARTPKRRPTNNASGHRSPPAQPTVAPALESRRPSPLSAASARDARSVYHEPSPARPPPLMKSSCSQKVSSSNASHTDAPEASALPMVIFAEARVSR